MASGFSLSRGLLSDLPRLLTPDLDLDALTSRPFATRLSSLLMSRTLSKVSVKASWNKKLRRMRLMILEEREEVGDGELRGDGATREGNTRRGRNSRSQTRRERLRRRSRTREVQAGRQRGQRLGREREEGRWVVNEGQPSSLPVLPPTSGEATHLEASR